LENWPILGKEALRENPKALVADDCDVRRMVHLHTSGTTGKPLSLWQTRETVQKWYAVFEARCHHWYGVSRFDRWALLGGKLVTPVHQCRPPFWVWNAGLQQLYMSSYHLSPELIPYYIEAIKKYRVTYVEGYTSSVCALAQQILFQGDADLRMRMILTSAEPLFDHQRHAISSAFHCPVRETYGMAESVAAASECEAGRLHLWPEAGWVEVIEGNEPAVAGCVLSLVCTGLLNADMPLIRYQVGDRGFLLAEGTACECGRTLPVVGSIEGRTDDVLYTLDGRAIGRLDHVFKADLPVREAQIVQEALDRVRVRYVPAPNFTPNAGRSIAERLQARMGPVTVILEKVEHVPREANGKFRAVISRVSRAGLNKNRQYGPG
jgi:phenylacetate-CoA ligase